ncbi:helix-turn-helix domain-containing protein [Pseudomonas citronellolis]|uniref:helix-turn-helix domain-containing protein n=1 Tax=Pseudomonas citronellolis TaxID=53408 RepID=UPI0023E43E69|nr:helix-turn-helix transcriptional regulator [Pseudomonas citronellolis]MDF3935337.1 helix-turn-helix transcriptional regulator [Pseudomonas citronellolis]
MKIGDRLKEERVRLGLNQTDFAALASVAKTSQFNYEKGDRSPDAEYLAAVAAVGVDVLYVVTGNRTPMEPGSITAEEFDVLRFLRLMPEEDRKVFVRMAHAMFIAAHPPRPE